MEHNRLLEIASDRETCDFCLNCGNDNVCVKCEKVKGIKAGELREYHTAVKAALRRTAEDDKAREEGPPCKVGDILYTNTCVVGDYFRAKDKPYACKVVFIGIGEGDSYVDVAFGNGRMLQFFSRSFGKTVFLTRQEAEAALGGGESD